MIHIREGTFVTMRAQAWQQGRHPSLFQGCLPHRCVVSARAPPSREPAADDDDDAQADAAHVLLHLSTRLSEFLLAHHDASPAACLSGKSREPRPSCA